MDQQAEGKAPAVNAGRSVSAVPRDIRQKGETLWMRTEYRNDITKDPSDFVLLADYVPHIVQEIRYYSTYNFIGERIDGYEEPCALLTDFRALAASMVSRAQGSS